MALRDFLFGQRDEATTSDRPAPPPVSASPPLLEDLPTADLALGPNPAYRDFGTYIEDGWEHFPEQATWRKRFLWHADVLSKETEQVLRLEYYSDALVEDGDYRNAAFVQSEEASAWRDLNRMVKLAADGKGFLPPADRDTLMRRAIVEWLVTQPIHQEPQEHDAWVAEAMKRGAAVYADHVHRLIQLGGDPDGLLNNELGWYIPILPWKG